MPFITLSKREGEKVEPIIVNTDRIVHVNNHFTPTSENSGKEDQTWEKNGAIITLDTGHSAPYVTQSLHVNETPEEVQNKANDAIVEIYQRAFGKNPIF